VQIGIVVPQNEIGRDPHRIATWAAEVEDHGFGYLDIFDHVLGGVDAHEFGPYTHEHSFHEPFVLYGFLAGKVSIGLSIGVLVLPQRPTALVAKQAAELDLLSGGRLRLGVGIGWNPIEYEALGVEFGTRAARVEDQIAVLRALWTEPVVEWASDHHRITRAGLAPLPARRPIPIWMGGGPAPIVLDRIGRLADGWIIADPHPGRAEAPLTEIRRRAERAGRDPDALGVQGRIDIHGELDEDRLARALDGWAELGVDHVSIHAQRQGDVDDHRSLLPRLARRCAEHLEPSITRSANRSLR
jgi:probable F420-dependent oxidoreductase